MYFPVLNGGNSLDMDMTLAVRTAADPAACFRSAPETDRRARSRIAGLRRVDRAADD